MNLGRSTDMKTKNQITRPPELKFSESGFLENWEEFDAWAKCNVRAWREISDRLYGSSEFERACALSAVLCSFIWHQDHDADR